MLPIPLFKAESKNVLSISPTLWYDMDLGTSSVDTIDKNTINNLGLFDRLYDLGTSSVNLLGSSDLNKAIYNFDLNKNRYMMSGKDDDLIEFKFASTFSSAPFPADPINNYSVFVVFYFDDEVWLTSSSNVYSMFQYAIDNSFTMDIYLNRPSGETYSIIGSKINYEPFSPTFSSYSSTIIETGYFIIHATGSINECQTQAYLNSVACSSNQPTTVGFSDTNLISVVTLKNNKVGECIFYNRILNESEINSVYSYLSNKWSI